MFKIPTPHGYSDWTKDEKKAYTDWEDYCIRLHQTSEVTIVETELQKQARIKRLLKPENFEEFIRYYFQEPDATPFAPLGWFHYEAIDDILVKHNRNNIWEWHRESAKSVFADIFIVCHLLFTGWLTGMVLASENQDKAKNLIKDVEAQLRVNKKIRNDFGDFNIRGSWMSGFFSTNSGIGFWAFGLGQNPAGVRNGFKRPNLGIVDDADNKDVAKNQKLTKERIDWVTGEFQGCLASKGRMFIFANNRVHKAGLTAHMAGDIEIDDPLRAGYKRIKVYLTEDPVTHERLLPEEGGVPAWKENYTLQDCIDKIEDMGYRNAMRQLYHLHIEDGNRFTDENMPWVKPLPLHMYDALVTYCDPAYGDSGKGCYRAITLIGLKDRNYTILWCWVRQKGNFASMHYEIAQRISKGRPIYNTGDAGNWKVKMYIDHWCEAGSLQLVHLKRIYKDENLTRPIPWYPKFDNEAKDDKIGRIESLEPIAEHGHLLFNEELKQDKDMVTLRDQFKAFPDGFIDGCDCVQAAIEKLAQKIKSKGFKVRKGKYKKNEARSA